MVVNALPHASRALCFASDGKMFSPRAANARGGAMTPRTAAKARHTLPLSSPLLDSTSRRVAAITPKGVELYGQSNVRLDSVESFRPLEGSSGLQSWANIMNVSGSAHPNAW